MRKETRVGVSVWTAPPGALPTELQAPEGQAPRTTHTQSFWMSWRVSECHSPDHRRSQQRLPTRQSKLSFLLSLKERSLIFFPVQPTGEVNQYSTYVPHPHRVCVCYLVVRLCDPVGCSPSGPLSMGFAKPRTLERVAFPSPGDLPNPGIEPGSPGIEGRFFTIWATREVPFPPGASLEAFLCDEKSLTGA